MLVTLGTRAYDLTARALVVATRPAASGDADVVEVGATEVAGVVEAAGAAGAPAVAVAAVVHGPADVEAAGRAGAALVVDPRGLADGATVRAAAAHRAAVLGLFGAGADPATIVERAHAAVALGVPPARLLLGPALPAGPGMLGAARRLAALGWPLAYDAGPAPSPAAVATAVAAGWRLVRTPDPRAARRVCAVLAAILEAQR
ncbi:MAG TPA: hypothetical protein VM263_01805 [Acidimicrobiales bacterium]|nr:hypothetical protein [Acidimicrobiales bacterium]